MHDLIANHAPEVTSELGCFDRVLFKGYLPIFGAKGMEGFLAQRCVLLKDFKAYTQRQSERLKAHALEMARKAGRPYEWLSSPVRKETLAQGIAERDGIAEGLVCVFALLESAQSYAMRGGRGRPRLVPTQPRCLCLYYYIQHKELGLIHLRLTTWFPFTIQVCVNGHRWLARRMEKESIGFAQAENCFVRLDNPGRAQELADGFARLNWDSCLGKLAREVNPLLRDVLRGLDYRWYVEQAEFSTDLLFASRESLKRLHPQLIRHAMTCFDAREVMHFLGRKLDGRFAGETKSTLQRRPEGTCVRHRVNRNWVKMYDKQGVVLRVETVIQHPSEFKVRRKGKRKGKVVTGWFPLCKKVSQLWRYEEIMRGSNRRYMDALARMGRVDEEAAQDVCAVSKPVRRQGRRARGLNLLGESDGQLIRAVMKGEQCLQGFRAADLARALNWKRPKAQVERRRQTARLNRKLRLLRDHGLIGKIQGTRRYRVLPKGIQVLSSILVFREETLPAHLAVAA